MDLLNSFYSPEYESTIYKSLLDTKNYSKFDNINNNISFPINVISDKNLKKCFILIVINSGYNIESMNLKHENYIKIIFELLFKRKNDFNKLFSKYNLKYENKIYSTKIIIYLEFDYLGFNPIFSNFIKNLIFFDKLIVQNNITEILNSINLTNNIDTDYLIYKKLLQKHLENCNEEKEKEKNLLKDKNEKKNKSNTKAEKEALKLKEKKNRDFNDMLGKIYPNIIKNNSNIFEVLLLIIYSVKKLSIINRLILNIPDGYNIEINDFLRLKGVPDINNIQFVDFLATINNLRELDVKFNSMEATTFEKILYMIKNNSNLKTLKLNFLPNENEYFSTYQLLKIEENNFLREMVKKNFVNKNTALNGLLIYDDIKDEYNLRKKAIDNLQKSFENFFVLLQMMEEKSNLESLTLEIDKPFNLIDKSLFWIILKLFFNLLLEFNRELLNLKEFIFIIPYLNLDNSYYSFIETFLNVINLNNKNKAMNYFHLKCQLSNIPNLSSLISFNLTKLSIGDLDLISFKNLVSFLHSNEFVENSKLKKLSIYLSKEIVVFRECQDEINNLIVGENRESLIELNLSCHFNISHDNLIEIMTKANGNGIELYNFIMEMVSENDYMNVFKGTKFYYSNKKYISCIDKYLPLLVKFKFLEKDKINISKRLLKFLLPSNRKKIIFKKIA
jgi:hypothetical protein